VIVILPQYDVALTDRAWLGPATTVSDVPIVLYSFDFVIAVIATLWFLKTVLLVILELLLGEALPAPFAVALGVELLFVVFLVVDVDELTALLTLLDVPAAVRIVTVHLRLRKQLLAILTSLLFLLLHH